MKVIENDHITSYSFESICDYVFDEVNQSPKDGDVLFLQVENFPAFLKYCEASPNKHVIVSVRSDFGIEEQALAHPNKDLIRKMNFMNWDEIINRTDAYVRIQIVETAAQGCNPSDKYSIKVYAGTHCTFKEVPENVIKWFAVNVNIKHPKIENIPFGLPSDLDTKPYRQIVKDKLLYVNFSNHTPERKALNAAFMEQNSSTLTCRTFPLAYGDYLAEMARHKFILCPPGNGWDCWRTYEALYLGCIPIMEKSIFSSFFEDLPILFIDRFFDINDVLLKEEYEKMKRKEYNWDKLKLSYWMKRIKDERNQTS